MPAAEAPRSLKQRLGLILLVTDDEWRTLPLFAIVSGCLIAGLVLGFSVANSIFMARVGAAGLAGAYMASAITMLAMMPLYMTLSQRASDAAQLRGTTVFLLVSLVLVRLSLPATAAVWGLLIFAEVAGGLCMLTLSEVTTAVYSPQQSKRLQPIIGAGGSFGAILAGGLAHFLTDLLGTANLLWVWAVLLLAAWLGTEWCLRQADEPPVAAITPTVSSWSQTARHALQEVPVAHPLIAITGLMVVVSSIIGYHFNVAVRHVFPDEASFTSYFALVAGAVSVFSLVAQLLLVGRLMTRVGVVGALLAPPLLLLVPGVGICLAFTLVTVTTARFLDQFFQIATLSASFDTVASAIPQRHRTAVLTLLRVVVRPLAMGTAGLLLLAFERLPLLATRALVPALLLLWLASIVGLRKRYLQTLLANLSSPNQGERLQSLAALGVLTVEAVAHFIRQALLSKRLDSMLFALQTVRDSHLLDMLDEVERCLHDESAEVRQEAARTLAALAAPEAETRLAPLSRDESPAVRRVVAELRGEIARRSATEHAEAAWCEQALQLLEGENDASVYAAIIRSLIDSGYGNDESMRLISSMLGRHDPTWRIEAAGALPPTGMVAGTNLETMRSLLLDAETAVRRQAALRLSGPYESSIVALLLKLLRDPSTADAAEHALSSGGGGVVTAIKETLPHEEPAVRARMCAVLGRIARPEALAAVLEAVSDAAAMVRCAAVHALDKVRVPGGVGDLEHPLQDSAERIVVAAAQLRAVAAVDTPASQLLREELRREMSEATEALSVLVGLECGGKAGSKAGSMTKRLLRNSQPPEVQKDTGKLSTASLDSRSRAIVLEVVDTTTRGTPHDVLQMLLQHADLDTLASMPVGHAAAWNALSGQDVLRRLQKSDDAWVAQCATWTLEAEVGSDGVLTLMEKVLFLRQVDLFREVPGRDLAVIAEGTEEKEFAAGEIIFREGDPGDALYLITHGSVAVLKGERIVAILGERECFGEMSILTDEPRSADIRTTDATHALMMRRQHFRDLIVRYPHIAFSIFAILANRLKETTEKYQQRLAGVDSGSPAN
jgi:HEAT repeat protein